jgi:short-subunit dehydrogenase
MLSAALIASAAGLALRLRRPHRVVAGRVVLVTGGSRGLGLEISRVAVRRGARVAICARDPGEFEAARSELAADGAEVVAIPCDVGDAAAVAAMVAEVERRLGAVDVLVANAGIITVGPEGTQTREDFVAAMDVMYWGVVNCVLAVLPGMRERRRGSIAVITSIGGKLATPHLLPYAGAKFAAVGFAEGLRAETAGDGVRVTTVVPGTMRTGSHVNAAFKGQHRREYSWFALAASLPLISVDAGRAARRVIAGIERGDAEVIIGLPARVATRLHGLFPATTVRLLGVVDRLLPDAGGIGAESRRGADSESALTESPATALGRRAARRQRQDRAAPPAAATPR